MLMYTPYKYLTPAFKGSIALFSRNLQSPLQMIVGSAANKTQNKTAKIPPELDLFGSKVILTSFCRKVCGKRSFLAES